MMKRFDKKENLGITLIALIITIIVLLILAGVVINMTMGHEGIITKAQGAVDQYKNAQEKENYELAKMTNEIDNYVSSNRNGLDPSSKLKEIYFYNIEGHVGSTSYTLDKSYSMVLIVVDGIGEITGANAATSTISITNTSKQLNNLLSNEGLVTVNKYRSTVSMAYIINPDKDTTITCDVSYRGNVHIYAL